MPTYQTITVDITPGAKEKPVLNASQFDNGRPFNVALAWGGVPFTDAGDFDIEIHVKKPDGNIVTAEPDSVVNEVCVFLTTEQMCACHGLNECEIILFDNDIQIGTGNFILDVEKAPDEGGIQSTSEIANLTTQVGAITLAYLVNNTDEIAEIITNKIYPTLEASGYVANFNTILQLPLVSVTADPSATIVTRCGVNLLDYVATSHRGITATKNSDGSLTLSGIAVGGNAFITANVEMMLDAGTYSFNVEGLVPGSVYFVYTRNGNYGGEVTTTRTITLTEPTLIGGYVAVENGTDLSTPITIKFSLVVGDTPLATYTPYNGITKPIAEATTIKTLTGVNNVFTDYGPVTVDYKYFPDI